MTDEMTTQWKIDEVRRALSSIRVPTAPLEYELHAMVESALDKANIPHRHEVPLAPRCRIDFMAWDIGIEVKQGKQAPGKLQRQAAKYLASPELCALILVTTSGARVPGVINQKPVEIVGLNRLWGVALP